MSQTMRVPYGQTVHGEEEVAAVVEVLRSSTQMGQRVRTFEARIADLFAKKHGVMVNSGSSALELATELLALPEGSEVITPALTFSSDVAAIYQVGCTPVFLDVGLDDYQVRVDTIEDVLSEETRAILIPDLIGGICDWDEVRRIADRHDLFVIHDSADTLGGKLRGRHTATRACGPGRRHHPAGDPAAPPGGPVLLRQRGAPGEPAPCGHGEGELHRPGLRCGG